MFSFCALPRFFLLVCSRGQPVRVFSSAPIVKRFDVFTLETADGICVVLKGFINKLRTTDSGFTAEVWMSNLWFLFPIFPGALIWV